MSTRPGNATQRRMFRGGLELMVLAVLQDGQRHGYALRREVERRIGWAVPWATLYPLLHRLQAHGWITPTPAPGSPARETPASAAPGTCESPGVAEVARRKTYRLTDAGRAELKRQAVQWQAGVGRWQAVLLPALRGLAHPRPPAG